MSSENRLWMGNIEPLMTEEIIMKSFNDYGFYPSSIKMIKDKRLNLMRNYCFINFDDMSEANKALIQLNGKKLKNANLTFKLNWANQNSKENPNVYVGNLSPEIDDIELYNLFKERYPSVHHASIITDKGVSKGFGFVHFLNWEDYDKCLKEMDGFVFHNNAIKVKERKKKAVNSKEKKNDSKSNAKKDKGKATDFLENNNNFYYYKINNNNNIYNCYNTSNFNMHQNNQINNIKLNELYSFHNKNRKVDESSLIDNESTFSSQEKAQDLSLSNSNSNSNSNSFNPQKRKFSNDLELLESDDQIELNKKIQESVDKMFEHYKYYYNNNESKYINILFYI